MSDKRRRDHSILLRVGGERYSVEFIDARKWDHPLAQEGLYRIKINGKFQGRDGEQFSFVTMREGVARALALLEGNPVFEAAPVAQPAPKCPQKAEVRVFMGEYQGPLYVRGRVLHEPHQELDGRWYVWVYSVDFGTRKVRWDNIEIMHKLG